MANRLLHTLYVPVAVLAIAKAGAACLPLDPDAPVARLAGILQDSGALALLLQEDALDRLGALHPRAAIRQDAGVARGNVLRPAVVGARGAAARQWLERIDNPDQMLSVQMRRASLLARQGQLAQARTLIQKLPARTPSGENSLRSRSETRSPPTSGAATGSRCWRPPRRISSACSSPANTPA
mgnify:CR=1 FL=1